MTGARATRFPGDEPTGKVRTFLVTLSKTVEITLDEGVIAQGLMPDDPIFGGRADEADVLEHLAFNLVGNGLRLSQIDGYANCPNESAHVPQDKWEVEQVSETTKPAKRKR